MLDAVFLEYSEPVVLPEANAETLCSFSDEAVEHPSCKITAVYTNDTIRRLNYSKIRLEQNFDAVNTQGQVIRPAGTLPELLEQNVFWPELEGFTVDQVLESSEGRIHYSFYLPEQTCSRPTCIIVHGGMAVTTQWWKKSHVRFHSSRLSSKKASARPVSFSQDR